MFLDVWSNSTLITVITLALKDSTHAVVVYQGVSIWWYSTGPNNTNWCLGQQYFCKTWWALIQETFNISTDETSGRWVDRKGSKTLHNTGATSKFL